MKNETKHVSFRLSQMSLDLLKQIAEHEGRSQSKQIEIMIRYFASFTSDDRSLCRSVTEQERSVE